MTRTRILLLISACMLFTACAQAAPAPEPTATASQAPNAPLPTLPFGEPETDSSATPTSTMEPTPEEPADPLDQLDFHNGWARIPFNFSLFGGYGTDQMNDITTGGPGMVVVGYDIRSDDINGAVWYSEDGLQWFRVNDANTLGGEGVQVMQAVANGPGGMVAVGLETLGNDTNAAVWFSVDGINWRKIFGGGDVFGDSAYQAMNDVTAFGNGFVAVGTEQVGGEVRGAVWTSTNGTTWQRSEHSEESLGGIGRNVVLTNVLAVGDSLIAAGNLEPKDAVDIDTAVWFSHDGGRTWTPIEMPQSMLGDPGEVRFQLVSGLIQGGPGFIMVGTEQNLAESLSGEYVNAIVWTSEDGLSWSRAFEHKPEFYLQSMLDVAATSLGYFGVGYEILGDQTQGAAWFSEDGVIWSQIPQVEVVFGGPGIQRIHAITEAGPGLVAVGTTTEFGEQDVAVWIYIPGRE